MNIQIENINDYIASIAKAKAAPPVLDLNVAELNSVSVSYYLMNGAFTNSQIETLYNLVYESRRGGDFDWFFEEEYELEYKALEDRVNALPNFN